MEKIKKIAKNQAVRYIFFGGCTTAVNLVSYAVFRYLLQIDITIANVMSIFLAILFAYIVNKIFVFESKTSGVRELFIEMGQFIGMRLSTMFIEVFGVVYMSCIWNIPDMVSKVIIQVVVLILNYIFSKVFVFNKERKNVVLGKEEEARRKRRKRNTLLGFLIPTAAMILAFAVNEVSPFGDRGILIIDSLHQYLPFFTEFHEKLVNSESLRYSFGGGLGMNFWATFAYYFASPLNFLIVLFPTSMMMEAMALLVVLKIGLSGGLFSYYLSRRNKDRNYTPILFGCMFALSNFMIGYYFNLMWLDSIAVLPLVMIGIEQITEGKSGKVFAIMFNQRTNCVYRKMHEMVQSGRYGQIKRVNWIITDWYRTQAYYNSGGWRATWDGEGGGVLLNQCPHNLDLLQWICGLPCRVRAFCHNGKWHQIEVEDDVTAYLEFPNGATGVFVTTTADAPGTNRFEITLERGKLVAEHDNLTFFELEQNERDFCFTATGGFEQPAGHEVTIELDGKNPQHVGVLNAFAGAILRGEPLVADGTEGIRGLELSNAMHLSSWTDQTVTLPIDEALFLEKLNEHRKVSKVKTEVTEATFDTSDSYGSKVSDNTDKGGVNA